MDEYVLACACRADHYVIFPLRAVRIGDHFLRIHQLVVEYLLLSTSSVRMGIVLICVTV